MMADDGKVSKFLKTSRDPQELQDWMFSLAPLGVAFAFFLIFMWPMDIPHKNIIIIIGAAAGIIGLESYWIFRGWKKNHIVTVLFGLIGISVTIVLAWSFMIFA